MKKNAQEQIMNLQDELILEDWINKLKVCNSSDAQSEHMHHIWKNLKEVILNTSNPKYAMCVLSGYNAKNAKKILSYFKKKRLKYSEIEGTIGVYETASFDEKGFNPWSNEVTYKVGIRNCLTIYVNNQDTANEFWEAYDEYLYHMAEETEEEVANWYTPKEFWNKTHKSKLKKDPDNGTNSSDIQWTQWFSDGEKLWDDKMVCLTLQDRWKIETRVASLSEFEKDWEELSDEEEHKNLTMLHDINVTVPIYTPEESYAVDPLQVAKGKRQWTTVGSNVEHEDIL